jgi:GNAT superfamily N-acetyltransferase
MNIRVCIQLIEAVMATPVEPLTRRYIAAVDQALDEAGIPANIVVSLSDDAQSIRAYTYKTVTNAVEICYIEVPEDLQGRGWASRAMQIITTLADQMGIVLYLTSADSADDEEWAMPSAELAAWYERNDFVGDRKMTRHPRGQPGSSTDQNE